MGKFLILSVSQHKRRTESLHEKHGATTGEDCLNQLAMFLEGLYPGPLYFVSRKSTILKLLRRASSTLRRMKNTLSLLESSQIDLIMMHYWDLWTIMKNTKNILHVTVGARKYTLHAKINTGRTTSNKNYQRIYQTTSVTAESASFHRSSSTHFRPLNLISQFWKSKRKTYNELSRKL